MYQRQESELIALFKTVESDEDRRLILSLAKSCAKPSISQGALLRLVSHSTVTVNKRDFVSGNR